MRQEDLIYMSYTHPNPHRTTVSDKAPKGVTVDIKTGEWSWRGETYKINSDVPFREYYNKGGLIGVYDRSDIKNLDEMLRASHKALREQHSIFLDD